MKIARKLVIALLLGFLAVEFTFALFRIQREIALFDSDMRRDHRVIGLTAAAALGTPGTDPVERVRRVDATRENVGIRFVSLSPNADPEIAPLVPRKPLLAGNPWVHEVVQSQRDGASSLLLVTYVRAPLPNQFDGAIELVESLAPRSDYVMRTVISTMMLSLVTVAVGGIIASAIGARMVGRPVSKLIDAARRIGAGEFTCDLGISQSDELGELAQEIARMSEQLSFARQRMEQETAAREETLDQLRHAERLATLGKLASVLAHEVGTPLNVIAGHAKLVATGRTRGEAIEDAARTIGTQCERISQLVRRILDYARRRPARKAPVDLGEVTQRTLEMLAPLAEERQVRLEQTQFGRESVICGDAAQIQQAITNVVLNAIQASPVGGRVDVEIAHQRQSNLEKAASPEQAWIAISVKDQGRGIPDELHSKVFEPFFTTKASGEGTGLGLSIVQEVLRDHGGRVSLCSEVEGGTLLILLFPEVSSP